MDIFLGVITSIIENITYLGVMFYLVKISTSHKYSVLKDSILTTFSTIVMYFVQTYDNSHLQLGAIIAISQYIIIVKLVSSTPIKNVVTSVLFTYILEIVLQIPFLLLVLLLNPDFNLVHSMYSTLFIISATALLTILILHFFPIHKLYQKTLKIPSFILYTIIFLFAFFGVYSLFFHEVHMPNYLILFFVSAFLLLTLLLVIFFGMQTHKNEQVIHYYETYLSILDDMILNIRKTQHNHSNTIHTIASLPKTISDYDSLAAALEQYSNHMIKDAIPTRFLHFDNKLLAALLYNKYCFSMEKQIHLDFTIHNHFYDSRANEFQIVDLTGILLDNAIEASLPNDIIYIEIGSPIQNSIAKTSTSNIPFSITVKNPGPEVTQSFIKQIFSVDYTSKSNDPTKHGLGLPYVKTLVHQCKGHIEASNEMILSGTPEKPQRYFVLHITI